MFSFFFKISFENKLATVVYDSNNINIDDIVKSIGNLGFDVQLIQTTIKLENLNVELDGISDENSSIAIEHILSIQGILDVEFPLKNDTNHVRISYDKNQIEPHSIYDKLQSMSYKVNPNLDNISHGFLRIQGMHCNSCVMNITQTVEDLPGVHRIKVSFDDQSANIYYDSNVILLSTIIDEIVKLGFQVAIRTINNQDNSKRILI